MLRNSHFILRLLPALLLSLFAAGASAQSFRVQCPSSTTLHPGGSSPDGSKIKCQQISGGDGFATMGDGNPVYLFGFGPLSGLADIKDGMPGTQPASVFNTVLDQTSFLASGTPSSLVGMPDLTFSFNGAIGLVPDVSTDPWTSGIEYIKGATVRNSAGNVYVTTAGGISGPTEPTQLAGSASDGGVTWTFQSSSLTGHVDPRQIMDVGVMNASQPAPLMAIDEDDEFFLTLTNVGQIMRPDLFEQHTVHFHGYPNASSFYDGVPDASIAINVGGSFTYYYLAPDAGTYFWHCHISPPEHLQMGMVGQIYVRPRQNRVPVGNRLYRALTASNVAAARPFGNVDSWNGSTCSDILCTGQTPLPPANTTLQTTYSWDTTRPVKYAYNDGDGSTRYDVEYPIQMMSFDPNFHFVGMTFNPESFTDMKDKYRMLNGRSYPDTIGGKIDGSVGPMQTQSTDGTLHTSQPLPTLINIPAGGRALLRISDLNVTEYHTLASLGIPMRVIALNARLLRDMAGNDMTYLTNSITLAGGESLDVILDATGYSAGQKFYLYTPKLDQLSNGAENFGGMMTEVNICNAVDPITKACS